MLGELQPWFGWSPWSIDRFRKDIDDLFDRFFGDTGYRGRAPSISMTLSPSTESFFKDGNWVVRADLPGVDPKDLDVSVAGNILTIRASRERQINDRTGDFELREVSYGKFERSIALPEGVKGDQIKATYQNGVLEVTMPAAPELGGRKIPIEIGTEEKKQIEHQAA